MADYIWITLWSSFFCATVQLEKMPGFFLLCSNRRTPTIFQGCYSLWDSLSFFITSAACISRIRSSLMLTPKKRKSTTGPLVFAVYRNKLCFLHHTVRCSTSSLHWPKASGVWPVGQNSMESCGHSNISRPIISVDKLVWIECGRNEEHNVVPDE